MTKSSAMMINVEVASDRILHVFLNIHSILAIRFIIMSFCPQTNRIFTTDVKGKFCSFLTKLAVIRTKTEVKKSKTQC